MITKKILDECTIKNLLNSTNTSIFIVPEYQRLYVWDETKAQKLFDDIWEFTETIKSLRTEKTYFLGTVVIYEKSKRKEIIDGQQRITSIFLLLRAIYSKLELESPNSKANNLMGKIASSIWETDPLTNKPNKKKTLLKSEVINDEAAKILQQILESGRVELDANDTYSINYRKYLELYDEALMKDHRKLDNFIWVLLDKTVILPIVTEQQDTALTIFSTLNDRGEPLSDADIFKAKLYKELDKSKRSAFIEKWKSLEEEARETGDGIQRLFYYYMFYLRASEGDNKTTTPGLRRFFLDTDETKQRKPRIFNKSLLSDLDVILDFLKVLDLLSDFDKEKQSLLNIKLANNNEILKVLSVLREYPNEFWKYPVIIYYMQHRKKQNFEQQFLAFLKKFTVFLTTKFLESPYINAIKQDIYNLNIDVFNNMRPNIPYFIINEQTRIKLITPPDGLVRMLLTLLIYNDKTQVDIVQGKWEIEHIFPQKWHNDYFENDVSEEAIKKKIQHLGNKTPLKKKLNIKAGNGYFDVKKKEYVKSAIKMTYRLAIRDSNDWSLDDIGIRDADISSELIGIFNRFIKGYNRRKESKK